MLMLVELWWELLPVFQDLTPMPGGVHSTELPRWIFTGIFRVSESAF